MRSLWHLAIKVPILCDPLLVKCELGAMQWNASE